MVAFKCGTPDRVPVAPQGFGRIPRDSPLGRELVEKTDIILYAHGGVDPSSAIRSRLKRLLMGTQPSPSTTRQWAISSE